MTNHTSNLKIKNIELDRQLQELDARQTDCVVQIEIFLSWQSLRYYSKQLLLPSLAVTTLGQKNKIFDG